MIFCNKRRLKPYVNNIWYPCASIPLYYPTFNMRKKKEEKKAKMTKLLNHGKELIGGRYCPAQVSSRQLNKRLISYKLQRCVAIDYLEKALAFSKINTIGIKEILAYLHLLPPPFKCLT